MSWKATAFVKELREGLTITDKFVLLILADYHRTDGKNEWPSMSTLASDCLMTERGVQQVIARLDGTFIRREIGGGRGNNNSYKFVGLDIVKGEPETPNSGAANVETVNETPHSGAENPAQPGAKPRTAVPRNKVLRVLPVLEPNGGDQPDDSAPEQQHPLNLAHRMIEMLSLPSTWKLKEIIAAAIVAESKFQGVTDADAAKYIAGIAMVARQRGTAIDKFYFEDTKWRNDEQGQGNRKSGAGTAAQTRSQRSIDSLRGAANRYAAKTDPHNATERKG